MGREAFGRVRAWRVVARGEEESLRDLGPNADGKTHSPRSAASAADAGHIGGDGDTGNGFPLGGERGNSPPGDRLRPVFHGAPPPPPPLRDARFHRILRAARERRVDRPAARRLASRPRARHINPLRGMKRGHGDQARVHRPRDRARRAHRRVDVELRQTLWGFGARAERERRTIGQPRISRGSSSSDRESR